jgi:hypothetical protein
MLHTTRMTVPLHSVFRLGWHYFDAGWTIYASTVLVFLIVLYVGTKKVASGAHAAVLVLLLVVVLLRTFLMRSLARIRAR